MRIAILSWESAHSIYVGGVAAHVTDLACALARKGQDIHVFTRMGHANHSLYECIDGVHYHRCPFDLHSDFVEEINNMCRAFVEALFVEEDTWGAFDIVHGHDWLTANALAWVKDGRGRKTVFTMHSTEYGRCGNNFLGGISERISHIEWKGMYCADKVISVSQTLRREVDWIYSLPEDKSKVIYNGVNCHDYDGWIDPASVKRLYEISPLDPMVLFAGRMVGQKGPDVLMEAVPRILKEHPHAKFVFVGDGGMKQQVQDMAHWMGVGHATRFLGHLRGWQLRDLFKAADCICVPSRNEPFGIVILEAWSAGKPVVASVNGGPSEIVWHDVNGLKIQAAPDSTEWGVNTLFSDFDHAQWMGRNGRMATETIFSWDSIADDVMAVYQN